MLVAEAGFINMKKARVELGSCVELLLLTDFTHTHTHIYIIYIYIYGKNILFKHSLKNFQSKNFAFSL